MITSFSLTMQYTYAMILSMVILIVGIAINNQRRVDTFYVQLITITSTMKAIFSQEQY